MIQSHSSLRRRPLLSAIACVMASAGIGYAESPTALGYTRPRWYDPRRYLDRCLKTADEVRRLEIFEQLTALAEGRPPDGSGGWFHDGQSRYGWEWLADRYDWDGDGVILPDDFPAKAADMAARLDRDENGKITKDDLDWSSNSNYMKQAAQTKRLFGSVDRDRNGHLTREEWSSFFDRAALDADSITPADLQAVLFPPQPPSSGDDPTPIDFLRGFVSGELGSILEGPRVGQMAPDFELPDHQQKLRLRLSQYRDKKPVVLIFGSFT